VSRDELRLVLASVIDGITQIAMLSPLHRAVALIRIDHSLCAAEVAFSVKSGEFAVLDGYSRCRSRHPTRNYLSGSLCYALIANAFRLMLSKPAANSMTSRFSSHAHLLKQMPYGQRRQFVR
jgi:hypothetical protein